MEKEELHISLKDQFLISPMGQWVVLHKNLLINAGIVVLAGLVWVIVKVAVVPDTTSIQKISQEKDAWIAKPDDGELYQSFQKSLEKVPSMRGSLSPQIAQALLNVNRTEEAEKWIEQPIKSLEDVSLDHSEFAKISLIVEKKSYQEALERSVSLKEKLSEKSILYCQNLLRIAFLQQMLKNSAGEKAAWLELEQYIQNNQTLSDLAMAGLVDQPVKFSSYIEYRKKQIDEGQSCSPLSVP